MSTKPSPSPSISLAQLLSLGYSLDDHLAFDVGFADEDGVPTIQTVYLIGVVDERGREPDFCYLTYEGFPNSGRVIDQPFAAKRADFEARIEASRPQAVEWRNAA